MSTYNYEAGPRGRRFRSDPEERGGGGGGGRESRQEDAGEDRGGSKGDDGISVSVSGSRRCSLAREEGREREAERNEKRRRSVLSLTPAAASFSLSAGP